MDGISRPVEMPGVATYKGSVEGVWASDARFTVKDDQIEGMIITPTDFYYLEAAQKYSATAQSTDYVFYKASDVRPEITRNCADTLNEKVNANAQQLMSSAASDLQPAAFSPFKLAEIATKADFNTQCVGRLCRREQRYSEHHESGSGHLSGRGLTFGYLPAPGTRRTIPIPAAARRAEKFTSYWNANCGFARRWRMWTGRIWAVQPGWPGPGLFQPTSSYGIQIGNDMPFQVSIPAHEIGHNFSAGHSDGAEIANTIMSIQDQNNTLTFCSSSIAEITSYVQQFRMSRPRPCQPHR